MASLNIQNDQVAVDLHQFMGAAGAGDGAGAGASGEAWIHRTLGGFGIMAGYAAITGALYKPPRGLLAYANGVPYYAGATALFFTGVAMVGAAVWVAEDVRRRHARGKMFLYLSIPFFLLSLGLGGSNVVLK